MAEWPVTTSGRFEVGGITTSDSSAVFVAPSASANTKGSWGELIASTAFPATGFVFGCNSATANHHYLIDIGVGGSGSETTLIGDLLIAPGAIRVIHSFFVPVAVPSGSRIAARVACRSAGANGPLMNVTLFGGGEHVQRPFQTAVTYGATAADSGGISVNAGSSANTKSSWVEVTSSTTRRHGGLMVLSTNADNTVTPAANYSHLVDVGVGGAGSEQALISNFRFVGATVLSGHYPGGIPWIPCDIPQGSRLAVRMQSSSTDAQDRVADFVLYGFS